MRQLYLLILLQSICGLVFAERLPEKLPLCASCHNLNGVSNQPQWPNLAHQSKQYMIEQLKDYQSGKRQSPIMQTYAKLLSTKEIEELANYYASQPIPQKSRTQPSTNLKGQTLYKLGNYKQGIPACSACHGPTAQGNDPAKYPALSHQHKAYLMSQLQAFKTNQRQNGTGAIMQQISKRLSEQDIQDVVDYIDSID